jgi:hypothetical protein
MILIRDKGVIFKVAFHHIGSKFLILLKKELRQGCGGGKRFIMKLIMTSCRELGIIWKESTDLLSS